ncbi:hypothetical protein HOI26_01205 [Candidatus Woesearchaeota archaeon]|jgi:hypothetical protein|nr:hypothetical protein [Candidatus Woesearchaeota archaeon]MBT5739692.1 hypothetical protein [Candidatus Woesearchaeota archaeon]
MSDIPYETELFELQSLISSKSDLVPMSEVTGLLKSGIYDTIVLDRNGSPENWRVEGNYFVNANGDKKAPNTFNFYVSCDSERKVKLQREGDVSNLEEVISVTEGITKNPIFSDPLIEAYLESILTKRLYEEDEQKLYNTLSLGRNHPDDSPVRPQGIEGYVVQGIEEFITNVEDVPAVEKVEQVLEESVEEKYTPFPALSRRKLIGEIPDLLTKSDTRILVPINFKN